MHMQRFIFMIFILLVTSCELSEQGSAPATILVDQVVTPSYVRSWFASCIFAQDSENQDVICPRHKDQSSGDSLLDIYLYQSVSNIDWYPAQIEAGKLRQEVSFHANSINTYINQYILTPSTNGTNEEFYSSASEHTLKKNAPFTLYNLKSKNNLYIIFDYELPSEDNTVYVYYGDYGVSIDTRILNDNAVLSYLSPLYKGTVLKYKDYLQEDSHSLRSKIAYLEPDEFNYILIEFQNTKSTSSSVEKKLRVKINNNEYIFYDLRDTGNNQLPGNELEAIDLVITSTKDAEFKKLYVCTSSCRRVEDTYTLKYNEHKIIEKYTLSYDDTVLSNSSLIRVADLEKMFYLKKMHYAVDDDNTLRSSGSFLAQDYTTGWSNKNNRTVQAYACGIVQGVMYKSVTDSTDIGNQYSGTGAAECDYYKNDVSDASGDIVPVVFYEYAGTLRYGPYHGYGDITQDDYNSEFNLYHPENIVVKECSNGRRMMRRPIFVRHKKL